MIELFRFCEILLHSPNISNVWVHTVTMPMFLTMKEGNMWKCLRIGAVFRMQRLWSREWLYAAAGCKYFWLLMVAQIQFWRVENPRDVRSSDILIGPPANPCPPLNIFPEQRRRREVGSPVYGAADDLWPYSTIRAGVLVLNQGSEGSLSDTIDFDTPQGGTLLSTCTISYIYIPVYWTSSPHASDFYSAFSASSVYLTLFSVATFSAWLPQGSYSSASNYCTIGLWNSANSDWTIGHWPRATSSYIYYRFMLLLLFVLILSVYIYLFV